MKYGTFRNVQHAFIYKCRLRYDSKIKSSCPASATAVVCAFMYKARGKETRSCIFTKRFANRLVEYIHFAKQFIP